MFQKICHWASPAEQTKYALHFETPCPPEETGELVWDDSKECHIAPALIFSGADRGWQSTHDNG